MKNINKNSLIIFGYSEVLTLGLVVNSKLDKVKRFNIFEDNDEDKFFKVISSFISNKLIFYDVYYSCGPGGFTIIRKIISYVKALNFKNFTGTKFIGFNHLFIMAYFLNHKYKVNDQDYILSILNHSNDNFVQLYQKRKKSSFFLQSLSEVKNIDLGSIENYLKIFNLSIDNVNFVYLGKISNHFSFLNNIHLVDRSNIIEVIIRISDLIKNDKISKTDYKLFFEEKFNPIYGKMPSTN